ncbi:hypothetical protein DRW07_17500 [Alteromonas sediminis]|uniref:FlgO domain-containing protein n=1 Tax=Alteromonas sediminis TaxID=2259342 RepID=A0A3N5XYQ2_9ALTE|nr:FlgO family outer membrane protein [Alteromonas sediminis]RPJ65106.1 hypothetical protein DRW07_17500 [Alteromonas sediminis]
MIDVYRFLSLVAVGATLSACSTLVPHVYQPVHESNIVNDTAAISEQLAAEKGLDYRPETSESIDADVVAFGRPKTVHKYVDDYADQLAMLLMERAFLLKQSDKIAVASFVRFNRSLREPTVFGNRLAEALGIELQQYGMSIIETKLTKDYAITHYGDLALSRNVKHLPRELNVDYILTGTLIERGEGVTVNARIVSIDSQSVAAAASLYIPQFIVSNEHFYIHGR